MAIKHIVTRGYGIAGTGVKYIPTRGYKSSTGPSSGHWWIRPWSRTTTAAAVGGTGVGYWLTRMRRRLADED